MVAPMPLALAEVGLIGKRSLSKVVSFGSGQPMPASRARRIRSPAAVALSPTPAAILRLDRAAPRRGLSAWPVSLDASVSCRKRTSAAQRGLSAPLAGRHRLGPIVAISRKKRPRSVERGVRYQPVRELIHNKCAGNIRKTLPGGGPCPVGQTN
jgi:hypothetical protein